MVQVPFAPPTSELDAPLWRVHAPANIARRVRASRPLLFHPCGQESHGKNDSQQNPDATLPRHVPLSFW